VKGTSGVLVWIERGLAALGVVLAVWCAAVLIEARYVARLPVPAPPPVAAPSRTLPGDAATPTPAPAAAPAPGTWLGRLEAPAVGLSATVLEGSDDGTLARGAGHIEWTPLPGAGGNVGIAGHRDTVFRPVRRLHAGETLVLTTADRVYTYQIERTQIVTPETVSVLDPTPRPTLTLVTCYPFTYIGHAPKRFIVTATLVDSVPRTD
jgi:sortase A